LTSAPWTLRPRADHSISLPEQPVNSEDANDNRPVTGWVTPHQGADKWLGESRFPEYDLQTPYHHRERPARKDEELTRVGPETPCGEYLRRFWQPGHSSPAKLGDPCRDASGILGETSSPNRDKSGSQSALFGIALPPIAGTSLEFGLIGDRGHPLLPYPPTGLGCSIATARS